MGDKTKDLEAEKLFDPGSIRDNPNSTNYFETLMHFLKSVIGAGIFAVPYAFKNAGFVLATISMFIAALICGHCTYIVVKCSQKFYYYTNKEKMTYADVANYAFTNGPEWMKRFSKFISVLVSISIFITYFGACSVYAVIVATNLKELILYYADTEINIRLLLLMLLLPFLLVVWIPNLKFLTPISTIANCLMLIIILIIFHYLFTDMPSLSDRKKFELYALPDFLANSIFALGGIGVVMPLENNMKKPKQLTGIFGILVVGSVLCAILVWAFGFFGYLRFGEETKGAIMQNLPTEELSGQIVKIMVTFAIFSTFGIQMYVSLDIAWNAIGDRYEHSLIANYILRTIIGILIIAVAVAMPSIAPFMGLIGAISISILGIILPVLIETVTVYEDGFGTLKWILCKNIILFIFGIFVLIFGTFKSILNIKEELLNL